MRPWLDGDLSGVDPREELELLRDCVRSAATRNEPLERFWVALAALDPVAAAELAAGPRALASPRVVRGVMVAIAPLEGVLAPSGLYQRLLDLAPDVGPDLLQLASRRHGDHAWVVRLAGRIEQVPGRTLLAELQGDPRFPRAVANLARADATAVLCEQVEATGDLGFVMAAYRVGNRALCIRLAVCALDRDPNAPVLAWLAAVHGPDLSGWVSEIVRNLTNPDARRVISRIASEYGEL